MRGGGGGGVHLIHLNLPLVKSFEKCLRNPLEKPQIRPCIFKGQKMFLVDLGKVTRYLRMRSFFCLKMLHQPLSVDLQDISTMKKKASFWPEVLLFIS